MRYSAPAVDANVRANNTTIATTTAHRLRSLSRTCTILVEVSKLAQASGERGVPSIRSFGRCRVQLRLRRTALHAVVDDLADRREGSARLSLRSRPCPSCTAPRAARRVPPTSARGHLHAAVTPRA